MDICEVCECVMPFNKERHLNSKKHLYNLKQQVIKIYLIPTSTAEQECCICMENRILYYNAFSCSHAFCSMCIPKLKVCAICRSN